MRDGGTSEFRSTRKGDAGRIEAAGAVEEGAGDPVDREGRLRGAELDRFLRHPPDDGGGFVLRDRPCPAAPELEEPRGAVRPHPGEEGRDGPLPRRPPERTEEDGDAPLLA